MFRSGIKLEHLQAMSRDTMVDHLGIEYLELGPDFIRARMPVDHRTIQPMHRLHGGASVALAETLGSFAANITVDIDKQYCVGLEINANHIKSVTSGYVYGITRPVHIGKKTHVWEIRITNEKKELVCISRITMAVLKQKEKNGI
jgi:1,4-dihydroxy-2-naphthoyl-CoA hydrolase